MSVLAITTVGDPVLRQRAREIDRDELASEDTQSFIDDLIATKRAANGAGLAANQVGDLRRIAIVEVEPDNPRYPYKPPLPLTVLVNPVIESVGAELIEVNEGCLSVPELRGTVPRQAQVRVRFLDRDGEPAELVAAGLAAGTFQHEVDHLDGVLFLDRVEDTTTFTTWEHADFSAQARAIVERYGS